MRKVVQTNAVQAPVIVAASVALLLLLPVGPASAQSNPDGPTWATSVPVSGQVDNIPDGLALVVELRGEGAFTFRAAVSRDGRFDLGFVKPGQYQLVVTDSRGKRVYEDWVSVDLANNYLALRLPPLPANNRPPSGTVSIGQLTRKVPRRAASEYKKALNDMKKGATQKAMIHLQNAIRLAPDYMEAHNELGICYFQQHELDKAKSEFQLAARLDSGAVGPAINLSATLLNLDDYQGAELAARRTLGLDPSLMKARLILGLSLHALHQDGKETMDNLEEAATMFSRAYLAIAQVLVEKGHPKAAIAALTKYLRKPDGAVAPKTVQTWVAQLQAQVSGSEATPRSSGQ